ncbi:ABC transporter ATP-binding protein [Borrelia miyamotoi]|uniref:ABC transporter ATP-binding protein n=1 Tax=Borrelia miyamotoi TaxID=47466 RepID=A0AAQ2WWG0_9SPIR|nr:ATP-binding cassette domain-containing protein [Borrelia miyamotoi]AGT27698.1 ABC-type transporter ATP-binding protein [Borrelia miyamotoi LB-2001]AJA58852.1 ABC transporter ATP-binding protein [Borrelia miyamotoi]AOW95941.1 ABC transporter ATP-binding protein [Borrelia miyamotoi]QTL83832.1 ABC transporter ATP-binding protein [Borrelia miyamotoi]WAZ84861.1 ABC transporter ATP-binding protein [Borrelia miyamotoi]
MINVKNVTKTYGSFTALFNVSFKVDKGEVLGILGPNGAGKSTLIKILTSFHYPNKGNVKIFGKDITENSKEILRNIGYIPEKLALYPELSVKEYLNFISKIKGIKNPKKEIDKAIGIFKLESVKNKLISELSKGFKQRVGIAGALINNPKLVILDEPTNGLDPNQIIEFKEFLKELAKTSTILFSSHILSEVESICKRIIIINNGEIIADDTKENIAKNRIQETEIDLIIYKDSEITKEHFSKNNIFTLIKIEEYEKEINISLRLAPDKTEKELFKYVVSQGIILKSMIPKYENLEKIFSKLTKEKKQ